ncbi:MAG: hypothetical protein ACOZNI_17190 [Myxococcota bacterium]
MLWVVAVALAGGLVETGEVEISAAPAEAVDAAKAALDARRFDEAAAAYGALAEAGGGVPARVAQAVALYEAGEMQAARKAAEQALAKEPANVPAMNVLGLAMVDGGDVAGGLAKLEEAAKKATGEWKARVLVNVGLARYDRGDAAGAKAALDEARGLATGSLAQSVIDAQTTVAGLSGNDAGVGKSLGRGDLVGAKAAAKQLEDAARTRRDRIAAAITTAAVERAEGRLDAAAKRLEQATKEAREAGLVREAAVALGNLGLVQSLGGRLPLAADTLRAGVKLASEGGYKVVEVDLRCELGIVLVHLGELDAAEAEQRAAGALLAGMTYAQGVARQAELGGDVAAARGDLPTAEKALSAAVSHHEKLGRPMDAARAATSLAAAFEPTDPAKARVWGGRAEGLFAKAGEALGPAHVAMALALADARAGKNDLALQGFARAAELAGKVGGERAQTVARIARDNAAALLAAAGTEVPEGSDLGPLVERQKKLDAAMAAFDAGLVAYNQRKWDEARGRFQEARAGFEKVSEPEYALRARRAAAWAVYNQTAALPAAKAYPTWQQLVEETAKLDEPELFTRTYAASALAAHQLGQGDPGARLVECAKNGERLGLRDVAARCHGAIAEREGDLDERAKHARAAHALAPADAAAVYACYAVAVDAYNAGRNELAVEMATLAKPNAGQLKGAVDEVLKAAGG